MGRVIPLFPRQTVLGAVSDFLSEPFEVGSFAVVNLELRVPGLMNPGVADFRVLTASKLSAPVWTEVDVGGFPTISSSPTLLVHIPSPQGMQQFMRAKLDLTGTGVGITFSLIGVAREFG